MVKKGNNASLIGVTSRQIGGFGKLPPGVKSPFTDEEIEEARKQPDGLPLSEVWNPADSLYSFSLYLHG
jgi:hypothetical protein